MISLHLRVKLRAFGITFSTIEDTRDVTAILLAIVGFVLKVVRIELPPAAVGLLSGQRLPSAHTLYNDRGVFIELV